METNRTVIAEPLVAEYDTIFSSSITDTLVYKATEYSKSNNYIAEKKLAVADCCLKHNIDVLVNVSYNIKHENGQITVIVSGLPAKFKRTRPATKDDLWMLEFIKSDYLKPIQ